MRQSSFYMVWRVDGPPPTVRHRDYETATREATRLARAYKGESFMVLQAMSAFVVADVIETIFDAEMEVPF